VKPEQASKVLMRMPTRHGDGEGSTGREVIDRCAVSIRRGIGNSTSEERDEGGQGRPVSGRGVGLDAILGVAARAGVGQGRWSVEAG
jgi:hypothetical protein